MELGQVKYSKNISYHSVKRKQTRCIHLSFMLLNENKVR